MSPFLKILLNCPASRPRLDAIIIVGIATAAIQRSEFPLIDLECHPNNAIVLIVGQHVSCIIFGRERNFVCDIIGDRFELAGVGNPFQGLIGRIQVINDVTICITCRIDFKSITLSQRARGNLCKIGDVPTVSGFAIADFN